MYMYFVFKSQSLSAILSNPQSTCTIFLVIHDDQLLHLVLPGELMNSYTNRSWTRMSLVKLAMGGYRVFFFPPFLALPASASSASAFLAAFPSSLGSWKV